MASGLMTNSDSRVRLVRCPGCYSLLQEPDIVLVYQCGGCGAVLRAKSRPVDRSDLTGESVDSSRSTNLELHEKNDVARSSRSESGLRPQYKQFGSTDVCKRQDCEKHNPKLYTKYKVYSTRHGNHQYRSRGNERTNIQTKQADSNMDALDSSCLGAVGSLIKKLDKMPRTEEDRIQRLGDDIAIIRTKLVELSMVYDPPLTLKYWMKDARELSYNMEDYIDHAVHTTSHSDANTAWTHQYSEFEAPVKEAIDRYHRYKLAEYIHYTNNILERLRFGAVFGEPEHVIPVGMEEQTKMLLQWVKPKEDSLEDLQLKVVSILGVEGIGKSTLARNIWRESDGKFQFRAFVQTARKADTRMILRSVLSQVRPEQPPAEASTVPNLIYDIRQHLQDKRYLIVIDDLWAISVWDIVRRAFPDGNCCCRIVTTTAVEDVAQACSNYDPSNIIDMKPLSHDQSRKLFLNIIFSSRTDDCPQQLNEVLDEITRKCGGLPLAIICIATLIVQPQQLDDTTTEEHQLDCEEKIGQKLDYVKNFLGNNFRTNSSMEIMTRVLNLCFCSFPDCMKTCVLYLSVYPENYIIQKEELVAQWIAEGFISIMDGKDIEEVARIYFDELVNLRLIQQRDISNCNKKGFYYTVHPLLFEFITWKSMEDNFITVIDYSQSTLVLTDKIRRLALHFGSATYASIPASIRLSQVRSLSCMGLLSCMPSLVEFKLVRVMILHVQGDDIDTTFSLTQISELLLLRYLHVRCNVTVKLPDEVLCLKQLTTLEIKAVVAAVPRDVFNHPSLLHVRLGRKAKFRHLSVGSGGSVRANFVVSSSESAFPLQILQS